MIDLEYKSSYPLLMQHEVALAKDMKTSPFDLTNYIRDNFPKIPGGQK
jgi:hypothetical protein